MEIRNTTKTPQPPRSRKAAVLTIHYVPNRGAILQSLATARLFEADIVDHRYNSKVNAYQRYFQRHPYLEQYIDNHLPLTGRRIEAADYVFRPTFRFLERQGYELIIVGSDEIWKTCYHSRNTRRRMLRTFLRTPLQACRDYSWLQGNPYCTPFPNVYWPRLNIPCIGFAGSIGSTEVEEIPHRHLRMMSARLCRFALIGVRDSCTESFFQKLCPERWDAIRRVPDPVFTYQPNEQERESAVRKLQLNGIDPERPFAFLNVQQADKDKYYHDIKDKFPQVADLHALPLTPPEWFAAIGMASFGISDAMHPFISSLVQDTPCLSIDNRFKSVELRREFGLANYCTTKDILEKWPEGISVQSQAYARRVRDFVQDARNTLRCATS